MGKSVLVFISHSSEDKISFIEPVVNDLENCYINVWLDKRKILPGDKVKVEMSPYDLTKGRIVFRYK